MGWVFMCLRAPARAGVFLALMTMAATSCDDSAVSPRNDDAPGEITSVLRSDRDLDFGCYELRDDFTFVVRVPTRVAFAAGDTAIDFELSDVDGTRHRLRDLLRERPVVLIFGSYT